MKRRIIKSDTRAANKGLVVHNFPLSKEQENNNKSGLICICSEFCACLFISKYVSQVDQLIIVSCLMLDIRNGNLMHLDYI